MNLPNGDYKAVVSKVETVTVPMPGFFAPLGITKRTTVLGEGQITMKDSVIYSDGKAAGKLDDVLTEFLPFIGISKADPTIFVAFHLLNAKADMSFVGK